MARSRVATSPALASREDRSVDLWAAFDFLI
jgi:hypothetical protein